MKELHRGDIYRLKLGPTIMNPAGSTINVLIMQNDDGTYPCEAADVIVLNHACNPMKGMIIGHGYRPDFNNCQRIDKHLLKHYVETIPVEQMHAVDRCFNHAYGFAPCQSVMAP